MKHILTLLTALLIAPLAVAAEVADMRPNIISLMSDDQTFGALGFYGNKDVITPNLDRLASTGPTKAKARPWHHPLLSNEE